MTLEREYSRELFSRDVLRSEQLYSRRRREKNALASNQKQPLGARFPTHDRTSAVCSRREGSDPRTERNTPGLPDCPARQSGGTTPHIIHKGARATAIGTAPPSAGRAPVPPPLAPPIPPPRRRHGRQPRRRRSSSPDKRRAWRWQRRRRWGTSSSSLTGEPPLGERSRRARPPPCDRGSLNRRAPCASAACCALRWTRVAQASWPGAKGTPRPYRKSPCASGRRGCFSAACRFAMRGSPGRPRTSSPARPRVPPP